MRAKPIDITPHLNHGTLSSAQSDRSTGTSGTGWMLTRIHRSPGRSTTVRASGSSIEYSYFSRNATGANELEAAARVTCKGQITIPKAIREKLGLEDGDHVVFRIEGGHAVLARTTPLLELGGSVDVPVPKRATPWDDVVHSSAVKGPRRVHAGPAKS